MQKRIVIIDDDQTILDAAGEFLRHAGYLVDTCDCPIRSNGLIYTDPPPDLVIIDVMMPLMTGDSKLKKLKSREDSRHIPVLLVSAKPEAELKALAAAAGAEGSLTKPFTDLGLLQAVRRLLRSG